MEKAVLGFLNRLLPKAMRSKVATIPVVRLSGAIMPSTSPLRPTLSLAATAAVLDKAFAFDGAPAVAIAINSPGGSAVQSRLIHKRIRDLAAEKDKRVLVFVEDVEAERKRLEAQGVTFIRREGIEYWGGVISTFLDPDGNYCQLIEFRPSAALPEPKGEAVASA